MVLDSDQLEAHADTVGKKAINLARLKALGCTVPPFVVIPTSVVSTLDAKKLDKLVKHILERLRADTFAVRSAALIEDDAEHSFAGQFLTHVDVKPHDIGMRISEVIEHARAYLKGDLAKCSIIVQEYIRADFSGVAFTRHPGNKRQMLVEYHQGIGEDLVSGKIKPESIEWYWNEPLPRHQLPLKDILPVFQKIERACEHPQDIEWCLQNGQWYLLQARPITTISKEQYQGLLYLDQALPSGNPFLYEQTTISEIAPRPTPFTLSILKRLYADNGPIQRVYQKYGVTFEARDFLRIIGNQLYVDREQELHTLLPSYSYFRKPTSATPTRSTMKGFWRSWQNTAALGKIAIRDVDAFVTSVKNELKQIPDSSDLSEIWPAFSHCYELIFEINLLAEISVRRLDAILKPYGKTAIQILSTSLRETFFSPKADAPPKGWIGNGLEIANTDAFMTRTPTYADDPEMISWWNALPEWRKTFLRPFLEKAVACDHLRERGRWLTVGYINALRRAIGTSSYFSTIEELENGHVSKTEVTERRKQHAQYSHWSFPPRLSNLPESVRREKPQGISSGTTEGVLVSREQLDKKKDPRCILYTEMLTPDLVQYFDYIVGIVSSQGGILSHLAILAREQHIPVVTNVDILKEHISIGDQIRIDGDSGKISVL